MHLTVEDVAALLRIPTKQVYRWIDEGELDCNWYHDQPRFNRTEVLEWAMERRIPVAVERLLDERDDERIPSLAASLTVGGIHRAIEGKDRDEVLRQVVAATGLPEIERDTLVEVLLAREASGSTGIGEGIAIPHVRQPIVMGGGSEMVSLCFLSQPVDFFAIDGSPVHTVFLIISTTVRGHLQMLARLSAALSDPGFRAAILHRETNESILREAARVESAVASPSSD
jgi:PTS system nitrogen regulatory IIA component